MRCPNCGENVGPGWRFCPRCGGSLKTGGIMERFPSLTGFQDLFGEVEKEFRRMEELFKGLELEEPKFEELKKPSKRGGGVSVRITREGGKEPKVEVETFGDLKGEEGEIRRRFGLPDGEPEAGGRPRRKVPQVVEEPETKVERLEDRTVLRIKVPGVVSMEDVEIRKMQESIEVRAYAEGKAYFTLSSIPADSRILSKRLDGAELVIEIG